MKTLICDRARRFGGGEGQRGRAPPSPYFWMVLLKLYVTIFKCTKNCGLGGGGRRDEVQDIEYLHGNLVQLICDNIGLLYRHKPIQFDLCFDVSSLFFFLLTTVLKWNDCGLILLLVFMIFFSFHYFFCITKCATQSEWDSQETAKLCI